ncbi:MAG TPA: TonB-dependent siderophore receptor [Rhizomicrobium sp.]|nr:TonB-dependent siderophore receptor [Rhizomicrobium sp.]
MLFSARAVALWAVLAVSLALAPAAAQTAQTFAFDVAPQPLSTAVLAFARQANVQVVFGAPIAEGLRSAPLAGRFTLQDAMTRLLSGTGLDWRMAGGTITISPAAPSGTLTFGTVTVEGTQPPFPDLKGFGPGAGANGSSDPIATEGTHSFTTNGTIVASAMPLSLLHTPQTVGVITYAQIQQQNMTDVSVALNYMPGVTLNVLTGNGDQYISRSFVLRRFRLDGGASLTLVDASTAGATDDLSEYDSVQVLRGSDGLLGSNDAPSGAINFERKRPLDHDQLVIDAGAGSWKRFLGAVDASGPLGFDGHLRGRAVLFIDDEDEFYKITHQTRSHLYAVVEGDLDADTLVRVGGSYGEEHDPGFNNTGVPRSQTGGDSGISRSTCLCATWNRFDRTATEAFVAFEHRFNDDWIVSADTTMLGQVVGEKFAMVQGAAQVATYRGFTVSALNQHAYGVSAKVLGTFSAFGFDQSVSGGVSYARTDYSLLRNLGFPDPVVIDVFHFNPQVLNTEPPDSAAAGNPFTALSPALNEEAGAFVSLLLQPADRVHVTLGARLSFYRLKQIDRAASPALIEGQHYNGVLTPSAALSYDVRPDISLYASYAEINSAQGGLLTADMKLLPPLLGQTYEAGIKAAPDDGKLNASLAFYFSTQHNQALFADSVDGIPSTICCYSVVGPSRSAGIDLQVSGEIIPGWQVQGGYTYNTNGFPADVEKAIGDGLLKGIAFNSLQPKDQIKIWTSYDVTGAWTVGGGLRFESKRYVLGSVCTTPDDPDCVTGTELSSELAQGPYAVMDLRVAYRVSDNWEAALNVTNVADTRYITTSNQVTSQNFYGEPRALLFSVHGRY